LLAKLPSNYIRVDAEYVERPGESRKVLGIRPCETGQKDPIFSPLCFTTLLIFKDKERQSDIEKFINNDDILNWYNKYAPTSDIVIGQYQQQIPFAYTPGAFMSPGGTGGETPMCKQFVYLLKSGEIIRAQIEYWPYKDGVRIK